MAEILLPPASVGFHAHIRAVVSFPTVGGRFCRIIHPSGILAFAVGAQSVGYISPLIGEYPLSGAAYGLYAYRNSRVPDGGIIL